MAGHGSPPPPDRALETSRVVHRDSGMLTEQSDLGAVREYRPPVGSGSKLSDRGTRFAWDVAGGAMNGGRGGSVRTLKRARTAVRVAGQRLSEGRDKYTGR
jgi:hypothetical protein